MAHWNEIQDEWRVEQARLCNIPNSEEVIRKYEETGDPIYWARFIELLRKWNKRSSTSNIHSD